METKKIVSIGADHAGFAYKQRLIAFLGQEGYEVQDAGTHSTDSVDYPDFAHPVALAVEQQEADLGILLCGTANGVAITANKHQDVRAALCWMPEVAALVRQHNDANILCIPARFVSVDEALDITRTFLNTAFEGGRHINRVNKIRCI
jgi:ribose 5-phosphate isomerase B